MGRKEFERRTEISGPATPQSPEELLLAQELRGGIDTLLRGRNYRSFDFRGKRFLMATADALRESVYVSEGMICGVKDVPLFFSDRWPTPRGTVARLTRAGESYYVEAGHVCLTLSGTYPRVNYIVPEDSAQGLREEKRNGADGFENTFHPSNPNRKVVIPARDGSLRPRVERLKFGKFLLDRIIQADSSAGKDVLLKQIAP